MMCKGIYHLFYRYNPESAEWGKIVWGHATSTDLLNRTIHSPALSPSTHMTSTVAGRLRNNSSRWHTGYTLYGGDSQDVQLQSLAVPKDPSDPYLVEWIKSRHNPIMTPNEEEKKLFGDPTTAWLGHDGIWRVIVGNERENKGTALLYKSKDFIHRTKRSGPRTGPVKLQCGNVPTFSHYFRMKHVLKNSAARSFADYYTLGVYDHRNDIYTPDEGSIDNESGLRLDYGRYYASKSFFDSEKKRRIFIAWVNESTSKEIDIIKGWSGLQSFPRKIWLDRGGKQLVQWPIEEIETLRTNQVELKNITLEVGLNLEVVGVTAAQADVEISFSIPIDVLEQAEVLESSWSNPQEIANQSGSSPNTGLGPFGLMVLASNDIEEYTAVFFRIFKKNDKFVVLMGCDQKRSSVGLEYDKTNYGAFLDIDPVTEKLSLRTLIDHSIVESFGGGGKVCITTRAYPTLAINENAHIFVFNNGSQHVDISTLSAWSLNQAQIN
ncbi:unnamed protein product [Withania somnifera]